MSTDTASVLPNLFLVGVPKAGSTSLTQWMTTHPDIVRSHDQELRFLMDDADPLARADGYGALGLDGYARHYPPQAGQVRYVLDATPQYYYQSTAKSVIPSLPDRRAIFVLRDPAERVLSMFRYAQNNMGVIPPQMRFTDFVDHIHQGRSSQITGHKPMIRDILHNSRYREHVAEWVDLLGEGNVRTVLFDDLRDKPRDLLRALAADLDIDPAPFDRAVLEADNKSLRIRNRSLHKLTHRFSQAFPAAIRSRLKPAYYRINTAPVHYVMDDADRAAVRRIAEEFRDWSDGLPGVLRP